jgi:hypothetical protein
MVFRGNVVRGNVVRGNVVRGNVVRGTNIVPDFSWSKHTKTGKNIPNDYKLYQTAINYTRWP